ncbi:hypothetical protein SCUCBS95973_009705 [Sporothrix curviconia]|uniref:Anaphase-promoting complex subunit 4 n=1 Tax=Sporothrix curviconia TaxID=1260050 RepID=A0ABP0CX56_9PEZI
MAGAPERLKLYEQSIFNPPADSPSLVAACPTIDLTAAVGGKNVVSIRRRGGEVVSKVTERNKEVQAVAWRSDGQFLAVAWSDGVVRLVGLESPKAVHQIRLYHGTPVAVTYVSWAKNLVGRQEAWQSGLLESQDEQQSSDMLDLPQVLLFLEVEDDLPKLPPLPVSGGTGDDMFVFSTRTSLEFMFRPLKPKDGDSIHIMVLGTADGAIHVSIYDTFVMGTLTLPFAEGAEGAEGDGDAAKPVLHLRRHTSHPASSAHALILANEEKDSAAVFLSFMDFTFIHSSPLNLSLLAFKTTTFQKLMRYIRQTADHMQAEWQGARELPARFLANIQEDLQGQKRRKNIDHALRVAAMTGYVPNVLKEWLVDTIAERGYRRWDKAVAGGLQNLRDLIHENMMPALDRAMLALSRLRGLAEFHSNDDVGFSAGEIAELMDIVACLILVAHNALALVTAELELFMSFSTWLRLLIERLALPAQAEEQADKEPNLSITPVIDYISNHLLTSPLDLHFGKPSEGEWKADWKALQDGPKGGSSTLLDKLEAEMEKVDGFGVKPDMLRILQGKQQGLRDGPSSSGPASREGKGKGAEGTDKGGAEKEGDDGDNEPVKAFAKFGFLTRLFSTQSDSVLKSIAASGWKHVHLSPQTRLSVGRPVEKAEVAMTAILKPDPEDSPDALSFTALSCKDESSKIYLFRSLAATSEGQTSVVSTEGCVLDLGSDGRVVDFQFLDAGFLLILCTSADSDHNTRLVVVPVQSPKVTFGAYQGSENGLPVLLLANGGLCWVSEVGQAGDRSEDSPKTSPVVRMEVLGPSRSGPDQTVVASSKPGPASASNGDLPAVRVCLMHADGTTYSVYSLPSAEDMFGSIA